MMGSFVWALLVSAVATGGFVANEASHGGLAEGMGMGHHHLFDYGGYHCVSHDDSGHGAAHVEHMHGDEDRPHNRCPGGAGMHEGSRGMH